MAAVPPDHTGKMPILFRKREDPVPLAPVPCGLGSPRKPVAGHELTYDQPTLSRLASLAREVEEVELALTVMYAALPVHGPEVHKARLAIMERVPVSRKPLAKDGEYALTIPAVPECSDKSIRTSHQPMRHNALPRPLSSYIQHMVQEDIGEYRTDYILHANSNFRFEREIVGWRNPGLSHAAANPAKSR